MTTTAIGIGKTFQERADEFMDKYQEYIDAEADRYFDDPHAPTICPECGCWVPWPENETDGMCSLCREERAQNTFETEEDACSMCLDCGCQLPATEEEAPLCPECRRRRDEEQEDQWYEQEILGIAR